MSRVTISMAVVHSPMLYTLRNFLMLSELEKSPENNANNTIIIKLTDVQ
ncbi:hypothetical protein [Methanosarcina sp.]|nr:hypothetical protein [Methanosarcina sp.]MDW5552215.1 hypothetical protein [Methanosarcina sp.]MDW5553324.1 hypothetical protein [Methanosarcina sp.]